MRSAKPFAPSSDRDHVTAIRYSWALTIALLCWLAAPTGAQAQPKSQAGQWSETHNTIGVSQVHMALLPGDGSPWHSRIVIFGGEFAAVTDGAELGWNPGTADCGAWPYPGLAPVPGSSWNSGAYIFCGGHAQLATGPGLLTVGGEDKNAPDVWGIPDALAFVPGSGTAPGSFSTRADMEQARFYPTITPLRDGRMMVTGGLRYQQQWYFGGRVQGIPPTGGTGDLLHRFGRGTKSIWDAPVTPVTANPVDPTQRPGPREGHTAVVFERSPSNAVTDRYQAFFGGKSGNGTTTDDKVYLLKRENGGTLDADYKYVWERFDVSGALPPPRSEHVAIEIPGFPSRMVVFGGVSQPAGGPALVRDDLWILARHPVTGVWSWTGLSQSGPGPRYGHAAAYDANTRRMFVFGGSSQVGVDPADNQLWVFTFNATFNGGTWSPLAVTGGPPEPRRDHTMVLAEVSGTKSLLVYGGYSGQCASSRDLWKLDLAAATPQWSVIATDGPSPGMRANHTAFYDAFAPGGPRLSIFGGDSSSACDPAVDNRIYSIRPFPGSGGSATWLQGPAAPYRLSGHTAVTDLFGVMHARIPEIYHPSTNLWTSQTGSGWFPRADLILNYPVQFLVPETSIPGGGGRILRVGQDPVSRYLDIPVTGIAGSWQTVPHGDNSSLVPDFLPITGVQYLPGKILVLGGGGLQSFEDNRAATFNAMAIDTAVWAFRGGMKGRLDPNILMLPNGKVLVLGAYCPQIWDPNTGSWTAHTPCALDQADDGSGYHSTAMLLPDGRVLTGAENHTLRVFCPPYLFDGNNLASRPTITSAPASMVYGETFVIGKQAADNIGSVCLIRPAAVTHSFDQNGRFVPLTFTTQPGDTALFAFAPTGGSIAPPGYYLLFILNQNGVPAIARWVRLGDCPTVPYDTSAPPSVTDLYADVVGPNEVWLAWSAPGDDRSPALGSYDLRISTAPITNEIAFAAASPVVPPDYPPPTPGPLGSGQSATKFNLAECTPYYFAIKAKDGCSNWTGMGTLAAGTGCGGGGGGYSAQRVDGSGEGASVAGGEPVLPHGGHEAASSGSAEGVGSSAPTAAVSVAPPGVFVAETRRAKSGGWEVTLRLVSEPEGFDPALTEAIVSQVRSGEGAWKTLGRHQVSAGQSPLGLCALRDQGRVVFPAGYQLDRVVTSLKEGAQELALETATHSRLGSLGDSFLTAGGSVEMALGDVVTFTYAPSSQALPGAASWYLLVRPSGLEGKSATPARRVLDPQIPTRFALRQNQPNPFRGATSIGFDLPVARRVTLEVFDLLGRKVATLSQGEYPAGSHTVGWDLGDARYSSVRPGVYVCRLTAGDFRAQAKIGVLP